MPSYEFTRIETTRFLVSADTLTDAREKLNTKEHREYGDQRHGDVRYWPTNVEWIDPDPAPVRVPEDEAEGAVARAFREQGVDPAGIDPALMGAMEELSGEVRVPVEARDHDVMPSDEDLCDCEGPRLDITRCSLCDRRYPRPPAPVSEEPEGGADGWCECDTGTWFGPCRCGRNQAEPKAEEDDDA